MANKTRSDIDDVVFENRNQEYGAYYLRKAYKVYVTRALWIGLFTLAAATLIPFFVFKQANSRNIEQEVVMEMANLDAPKTEDAPPPPPPPPPEALEQKVKFTAPVVTSDTVEDTGALNQDDLNEQSTNTEVIADDQEIKVEETENVEIEQAPLQLAIVEVQPTFEGGEEAMYSWLASNIKYPQVAKETNITGKVIVSFVVERDGSISNVSCVKDIGGGCGDEGVRVVKSMPKWKPGKQNGVAVRVQFYLPIQFSLE